MGLESLKRCLEWCLHIGVQEVSVYAFSVENFKREKEEVDVLMTLARENLRKMAEHGDFLQQYGVKVNICGDLRLCPESVQQSMQEVIKLTEKNEKLVLNVCFAYNSS